jgi:hypothetical protein
VADYSCDFDTELSEDAEVEAVLDAVTDLLLEADSRTAIVNPYRMKQMADAYKVLTYLLKGSQAKITYTLHKPYKSVGCIKVTGKTIKFSKPEWFIKAAGLASNFEVFPKIDGTLEMNFTFHGLTESIE